MLPAQSVQSQSVITAFSYAEMHETDRQFLLRAVDSDPFINH